MTVPAIEGRKIVDHYKQLARKTDQQRSMLLLGIPAIIAESFARIFFRNALNQGLAVIECKEAVQNSKEGDELEINLRTGEIHNLSTGKSFQGVELPEFILDIISKGGAIAYYKEL